MEAVHADTRRESARGIFIISWIASISACITGTSRAIVDNHMYVYVCDFTDFLTSRCRLYGVVVNWCRASCCFPAFRVSQATCTNGNTRYSSETLKLTSCARCEDHPRRYILRLMQSITYKQFSLMERWDSPVAFRKLLNFHMHAEQKIGKVFNS